MTTPRAPRTIPGDAILVRVVSTADCPSTPPTLELIEAAARELGLLAVIGRDVVTTQAEADRYRLIGSPTVQIDGLDLEPEMRACADYGLT